MYGNFVLFLIYRKPNLARIKTMMKCEERRKNFGKWWQQSSIQFWMFKISLKICMSDEEVTPRKKVKIVEQQYAINN